MNLLFLNPAVLWFLPLALLPVAIHLFFRRKPVLVRFSYLRFIEAAARDLAPRRKLRQLLLLVTRCLIVLLLITAFARPAGRLGASADGKKNREIVLLLDSSYSMNYRDAGRDRLTAAKDFVYSVCRQIFSRSGRSKTSTGILMAAFSDRIERYAERLQDITAAKEFLDSCNRGYSGTDLIPALNFAYKTLSKFPEAAKTVIIVSDMSGHIFNGNPDELKTRIENYDASVAFIFVEVGPGTYENSFVKDINAGEAPSAEGGLTAELSCFAGAALSRPVSVTIDGRKVFEESVLLKPAVTLKKEFYNIITAGADSRRVYFPAEVRLQEDMLADDDIRRTVLKIEPVRKVLIVEGETKFGYGINSESYYLNAALQGAGTKRFKIKTINADDLSKGDDFSKYDVVALCNLESIQRETLNSIEADLPGAVAIFPGDKMNPSLYPQWISENFPVSPSQENVSISSYVSAGESLALSIFPEINGFETGKINFSKYYRINGTNGETVVKLNNGLPFMVRKLYGGRPVYIFAAGAGKSWGNFPSKPFYPYFVRSVFGYNAGTDSTPVNYTLKVGEPFRYFLKSAPPATIGVSCPDKSIKKTKVIRRESGADLIFEDTFIPGFYTVQATGGPLIFAVNVNSSSGESNLDKIDRALVGRVLPKTPVSYVKWDKDTLKRTLSALEGVDLSGDFLTAALLLLGMEIILSGVR